MATGKLVRLRATFLNAARYGGTWCLGFVPAAAACELRLTPIRSSQSIFLKEHNSFDELNILQSIVCLTTHPADPAK